MSNSAIITIGALVPNLPFVAVAIFGLVSLKRLSRFPRGARWATVGFVSVLLEVALSLVSQYYVASASEGTSENYVQGLVWTTTFMYFLRLAGLSALAVAVFIERAPAQQIAAGDL